MTQCFICDVDGTVADLSHRLPAIKKKPKDWDGFFLTMQFDKPIEHMREVLKALAKAHPIIYCSGRPERYKVLTSQWLQQHQFPFFSHVPFYMRADGDRRDDSIIKAELLALILKDGWEPIMAFDDRNRVVEMWRSAGIPCAQVAPGDF